MSASEQPPDESFLFEPMTAEQALDWLQNPNECVWCARTDGHDGRDWIELSVSPIGPCWGAADDRIFEKPLQFCNLICAGHYLLKVAGGQMLGGEIGSAR